MDGFETVSAAQGAFLVAQGNIVTAQERLNNAKHELANVVRRIGKSNWDADSKRRCLRVLYYEQRVPTLLLVEAFALGTVPSLLRIIGPETQFGNCQRCRGQLPYVWAGSGWTVRTHCEPCAEWAENQRAQRQVEQRQAADQPTADALRELEGLRRHANAAARRAGAIAT